MNTSLPLETWLGTQPEGNSPTLLLTFKDVFHKLHCLPIRAHSELASDPPSPFETIHMCFPTSGGFYFLIPTFSIQHQSALPPPPPPQRLCAASPFVIGISLMKKGWCLSHYSCGEGEDLGTNLLALTREDTCLHQEFNFPSACGNKRARFV